MAKKVRATSATALRTAAVPQCPPAPIKTCGTCGFDMPIGRKNCPHCAQPSLFPNVDVASTPAEKAKLDDRYSSAHADAGKRGCAAEAASFEAACTKTVAVMACSLAKLHRQIGTGTQIYETYYDLEERKLNTSAPGTYDWAKLRPQAEIELLGSHHNIDQLHYACLSIGGHGLARYGDCLVTLAERMVCHRSSCFEGNTAIIYAQMRNFDSLLRSDWDDRHRMCLATFAEKLAPGTPEVNFPSILVENGTRPDDDRFIEVHVFGPMTARTFESVRVTASSLGEPERTYLSVIEERLKGVNVPLSGFESDK